MTYGIVVVCGIDLVFARLLVAETVGPCFALVFVDYWFAWSNSVVCVDSVVLKAMV